MADESLIKGIGLLTGTTIANDASHVLYSTGKTWYGAGHRPYMRGISKSQSWVNNHFDLYLYYTTSDNGSAVLLKNLDLAEGDDENYTTPESYTHKRWKLYMVIDGDGKAYGTVMFYIYNGTYQAGDGFNKLVSPVSDPSPSSFVCTLLTNSLMTKSHLLCIV